MSKSSHIHDVETGPRTAEPFNAGGGISLRPGGGMSLRHRSWCMVVSAFVLFVCLDGCLFVCVWSLFAFCCCFLVCLFVRLFVRLFVCLLVCLLVWYLGAQGTFHLPSYSIQYTFERDIQIYGFRKYRCPSFD